MKSIEEARKLNEARRKYIKDSLYTDGKMSNEKKKVYAAATKRYKAEQAKQKRSLKRAQIDKWLKEASTYALKQELKRRNNGKNDNSGKAGD